MSRICPALQKLIDDKAVSPSSQIDLQTMNRRLRITWLLRRQVDDKTTAFDPVDETLERMNRRAAAGLPMVAAEMKKSARVQKVMPKPRAMKTAKAAKVPKPQKVTKTKPPIKEAPTAAKPPAPVARVIFLVDRSPSMLYPASLSNAQIPRFYTYSDPLLKGPGPKRFDLVNKQVADIVAALSPNFLVDVADFDHNVKLVHQGISAGKLPALRQPPHMSGTSVYVALSFGVRRAATFAANQPVLLYLLTDGDNNGPIVEVAAELKSLLATGKVTVVAIGPKSATSFLRGLGVPDGCIRDWEGGGEDMKAATTQAVRGAKKYTEAVKQGKTKLDSFFVDVVAAGLDVAKAKRELRDITSSLRRRKIGKFEEVKPYVETELKKVYVDGAAYYQLSKPETLLKGRRVILQPRSEEVFLAGPTARKLLGLPDDRDCKIEPKNLGEFVMYVQSASPNRKLLPGTTFLYDESHVPGATEPTWFRKGA